MLAVGGNDGDRHLFARRQHGRVVAEGRDVDGDEGGHTALPAPAADDDPCLARRRFRHAVAPRVLPVEAEFRLAHGQGEQGRQEGAPGRPARGASEGRPEEDRVVHRLEDCHTDGSASRSELDCAVFVAR